MHTLYCLFALRLLGRRSRGEGDVGGDAHGSRSGVDRYQAVRQYSLGEILGVWAAAAVPMGLLAWVVAPWLADRLGGDEPLTQALLILLTVG